MKTLNITNLEILTLDSFNYTFDENGYEIKTAREDNLASFTLKIDDKKLKYNEWIVKNEYTEQLELEKTDCCIADCNDETIEELVEAIDLDMYDRSEFIEKLEKYLNKEIAYSSIKKQEKGE